MRSAAGKRSPSGREFAWFARFGLLARGVSYGIIGILAIKLAVGAGGKATTQRGALLEIAERPFGRTLLIAIHRAGQLRDLAPGSRWDRPRNPGQR